MSGRQYPDQSVTKLNSSDNPSENIPSADTPPAAVNGGAPADDAWQRVTSRMRQDIGEAAWRNWIKPLRVSRLEDGTLTLEANSTLARERVTSQYADRLRVISAAEYGTVRKVEISLASQQAPRMSQQKRTASGSKTQGTEPLGAGLDPRYTFANFVVGKPNELAFAVARRTAESSTVAFNPLFLYGGVGLGKTHLMHAIAWHIR
ncbi:MAG: DnaA ATPase domain-containing protein, partial [Candidatus Puniceispirillaceae bacterium]